MGSFSYHVGNLWPKAGAIRQDTRSKAWLYHKQMKGNTTPVRFVEIQARVGGVAVECVN